VSELPGSDDRIRRGLQELFAHEVARAQLSSPLLASGNARSFGARYRLGTLAVVGVLAILVIGIAVRLPSGPVGNSASQVPTEAAAVPTANQSLGTPVETAPAPSAPTPTSTPVVGPLAGGVPRSIGAEEVLQDKALLSAIAASSDSQAFLAGGWFHKEHVVRFCPYIRLDAAVDGCTTFGLYSAMTGGEPLWVGAGDAGLLPTDFSTESTRPIVIRVHTHDPRCPGDDSACRFRPVLLEIVWVGDVVSP
jgi:hypothetical protein